MPNKVAARLSVESISDQYPELSNVFSSADGPKLTLRQSSDCVLQNMFYDGWEHDHFVTVVLV